jgi:GTP-binding protein
MSKRNGDCIEAKEFGNRVRLIFHTPSRSLLGFRHSILSATRGNATVNSAFLRYSDIDLSNYVGAKTGKLVSVEKGRTTGYSLMSVEERGHLFIGVGEDVYEGMVLGENAKTGDLDVNPCRAKKLTNVRSTGAEEKVSLTTPRKMTVEEFISYMDEDEVLEVTPKSVRLRKRILESGARLRFNKSQANKANKANL